MDGVGQTVQNYCTLLSEKGHTCYAIVSGSTMDDGYAYDRAHNIDYTIRATSYPLVGIKPYGIVHKGRAFRRHVNSIEYDLIHSHSPFYMGSLSEQVRRAQNVPLIATFHTLFKDDIKGLTRSDFITAQVLKRVVKHFQDADEVWTPTEWSRNKLFEYGVDREVEIVANGCDMLIPSAEEQLQLRREGRRFLNIDDETPNLIYIGQLKEEKNLTLLVEALAKARSLTVPFRMIFVGSGSDRIPLERLVERHGLASSVIFTGRITDRQRIKELLAASSMMLFPSQYDTSALVLYEAAAFAVPMVNTVGSATASRTTHDVNGFIAKNDAASFGEEIIRLLKHPALVQTAGLEARRTIYRHWSVVVDEVAERYQELYQRFGASKRP